MNEQLDKYFLGELSDAEKVLLFDRIESDPDSKAEFIRMQNTVTVSKLAGQSEDAEWSGKKMKELETRINRKQARRLYLNLAKYAAVIAILLVNVWLLTDKFIPEKKVPLYTQIKVPTGQRIYMTLQDGTEAWLSPRSIIRIPSEFSKDERSVELDGEGFFSVTKDAKRPFIVKTQGYNIKVLGTKFNVFAYTKSKRFETNLVEGSVQVINNKQPEEHMILKPNEMVSLKDGVLVKSIAAFNNEEYLMFHASLAVLGVGAALLCTSAATLNACGQTLKEWAAQLLLPKAPKAGKRIFLERITPVWKRMKFTHKVTARNLFRYKKRFFMTVIGVAGCTALLVTGFGLKDSISDIVSKQFGKVFTYDFLVTLSKESALKDAGFQALMDAPEQVTSYLPVQQEHISLDVDGQSYDVYLFVPEDEARLDNFIDLHERKSGAAVPLTDDGVVITEKFSDEAGLSPGDTLTLENGEGREGTFTVTGVAENYVENYVYMTPSVYEDAYGSALEYNSVLGILPDDAQDVDEAFSTSLLEVDGVAGLTLMSSMRSSLDDTIASINYVVYVIILCAGMLAFVVLYNLMNINITERTKEIATIKVLGFFEREVEAYVYRESNVLTVIGMLLGLVGGIFLHMFIMRTVEVDMVMFGRDIKPLSFVLSAVLTVVFSLLVNLGMKRKLRNISMVESMKAPE